MRKLLFIPALVICSNLFSQTLKQIESKKVNLPNGWSLTPVGKDLPLGDLPLNMAVSPSRKLIAVTNNGQSVQSLQLIDAVWNDRVAGVSLSEFDPGRDRADQSLGTLVWLIERLLLKRYE
jgi:hypothetical protein